LTRLFYFTYVKEEKEREKGIVGNIIKYSYREKTINNMVICLL